MTRRLEAALALNGQINVSSGLSHPDDAATAKQIFSTLHGAGEILTAQEVSTWAVMNGWDKDYAKHLGALAEQIGLGKQVKLGEPRFAKPVLELIADVEQKMFGTE